jgi:hypoxanthine phosphoribosyltransferase
MGMQVEQGRTAGTSSNSGFHRLSGEMHTHHNDIEQVLISEEEIQQKTAEVGEQITRDYAGQDLLMVGVLKGAFVFMADLSRHISLPMEFDFMAVSSYGAATQTSGVVRILKDLDHEILGRHVLVVEDIVDSGLTLSYLLKNLRTRKPATLEVCALMQKTGVQQVPLDIKYKLFEIPAVFVVGYGLDYGERFRNLPFVGTLRPEVYRDAVS